MTKFEETKEHLFGDKNINREDLMEVLFNYMESKNKELYDFIGDITDRINPKDENLARFYYWGKTLLKEKE